VGACMSCAPCLGTQTVVLAMALSIMGPARALRGPDGCLHDAVVGMQKWTSFVIVLFLASLILYARPLAARTRLPASARHRLIVRCEPTRDVRSQRQAPAGWSSPARTRPHRLQLGALSFTFGHTQIGAVPRLICSLLVVFMIACTFHYASIVLRRFALHPQTAVSGAFFLDGGKWQSRPFKDFGMSSRRSACAARRLGEHELLPLTRMEFLDGETPDEPSKPSSAASGSRAERSRGADEPHAARQRASATPRLDAAVPSLSAASWVMLALDGRVYDSDGRGPAHRSE